MSQLYRTKRNRDDNEETTINATIIAGTTSAVKLDFGGNQLEWFPRSQVTDNRDGTFTMPTWLAVDKGAV